MPATNILIVAWDREFIDKFARLTLPCLMAKGNLPGLAKTRTVRILLHTDNASRAYFLECLEPLRRFAEIQVHSFEDTTVDGTTIEAASIGLNAGARKHEIDRLSQFHAIDLSLDDEDETTLFILNPDMLIADGAMRNAQGMIDGGAEVVATPTLRLSTERLGLDPARDGAPNARDICNLLPTDFHPTTRNCLADSDTFTPYPATILWRVEEQGWLCRTFFPLPLAFRPTARCRRFGSTIDYDFALNMASTPEKIAIPRSSDDVLVCKCTTEDYLSTDPQPSQFRRNGLAHFLLVETNRAHRTIAAQPFRLVKRGEENEAEEALWNIAESQTAEILDTGYATVDKLIEELPPDTPDLQTAIRSHFGGIEEFLSPMRRSDGIE